MNRRPETTGSHLRHWGALGFLLLLAVAMPAAAQVGPLTNQNLFFDQASNAHVGNYLAVETGLVYTDNAQLTANGSGSVLALLGLVGDVTHVGAGLDYHLDSDLAVVKYFSGGLPTRPAGFLDGSLGYKIVPGTLTWIARESYTQQAIDPFLPPTPQNLEDINEISTGPRLVLRPTLRTTIALNTLASYVYSSSPSDLYINVNSFRYSGDLTLDRAFTSASSAYLRGNVQRVNFTDTQLVPVPEQSVIGVIQTLQPLNSDYTLGSAVAGFKFDNSRTLLDASGGVDEVRVNGQTFHGGTWNLNLSRLITPFQRVALLASQQLTDQVSLLRQDLNQAVPILSGQQLGSGDPFTNREFGADWRFEASRTAFDVSLLYASEKFVLNPAFDLHAKFVNALAARQLTPVLNLDVGVRYEHQNVAVGGPLNITSAITNLRWQLGPRVEVRFLYAHSWQSPNGYVDNQVGATVSYAVVGNRAPIGTMGITSPLLSPMSPMSTLPPLH